MSADYGQTVPVSEERVVFVGVDTGGTYTDAVVYDEAAGDVLAKAKAPTTHDDLAIGIQGALDRALAAAAVSPASIRLVSLSTTLATNALVEGMGRPACLVMIGFGADALERGGLREAIGSDAVISIAGGHTSHGTPEAELDLATLRTELRDVDPHVEAFAVTGQFGVRNPEHELAARDVIREITGLPVTCSHELSDALNGPKRSVTALLNARLIVMIDELVSTTAQILADRNINAPIMVVRGNGSLVSSAFVRDRPVETILSGPAASLIGAAHLADLDDAIISDIGGTTTDIAVLRGGLPEFGSQGATVGGHQTMVEAVLMHTHGIGGDSEISLADRSVGAELVVGPRRVIPIALAAESDAGVIEAALRRQLNADTPPAELSGAFVRASARAATASLDRGETALLERLGDQLRAMDEVARTGLETRVLRRLITRGLIRVSAITPTDASHVLGVQATHDDRLSRLAADVFARRRDRYGNPIAASAAELSVAIVNALVRRSAEALLDAALIRDGLPPESTSSALIQAALDRTPATTRVDIGLGVALVGLGAPASSYYPAIGELLGTSVEIPEHADVANAIGAVVGKVRVRRQVIVSAPRRGIFRVHAGTEMETLYELDSARERAIEAGRDIVEREMVAAGAPEFEVESHWEEKSAVVDGRAMFVEGVATVIGSGRPKLD